jgi:hypothetical protein
VVWLGANQEKAYPNTIGFDEAAQRRVKRCQETFPRTLWVKASEALQALAHRGDANARQQISVGLRSGRESQVHLKAGYVGPVEIVQRSSPSQFRSIRWRGCVQGAFHEM